MCNLTPFAARYARVVHTFSMQRRLLPAQEFNRTVKTTDAYATQERESAAREQNFSAMSELTIRNDSENTGFSLRLSDTVEWFLLMVQTPQFAYFFFWFCGVR